MVDSRNSIWQSTVLGLGIGLCLAAVTPSAVGQTYKEVGKAITDPRAVGQLRREVSTIVRSGGALSDADRKTLQNYYVMHVIAGMTRSDAATNPERYPDWRKTVVGDLSALSGSAQIHTFVRNLIFSFAGKLVQDRAYSPAARYNALLMIGELNERESQGSGRSVTPAVPYTPARQALLAVLNSDDSQDMKVGALIGLARHARLIAAANGSPNAELLRAFVDVLQEKDPGNNGTVDGLIWMHRIAIDALGDIGQSGAARILEPIISDASSPMMLRCAAANALGRLDYRNAANIDQAALLKGLGQLATNSLAAQIQGLQTYLQENPPDAGLIGERSFGGTEDVTEDPFVRRVRRQLKYELECVRSGLRALQSATTDAATKNAMTALESQINEIRKELEAKNLQPQELFDKIGAPAARLENTVKNAS